MYRELLIKITFLFKNYLIKAIYCIPIKYWASDLVKISLDTAKALSSLSSSVFSSFSPVYALCNRPCYHQHLLAFVVL